MKSWDWSDFYSYLFLYLFLLFYLHAGWTYRKMVLVYWCETTSFTDISWGYCPCELTIHRDITPVYFCPTGGRCPWLRFYILYDFCTDLVTIGRCKNTVILGNPVLRALPGTPGFWVPPKVIWYNQFVRNQSKVAFFSINNGHIPIFVTKVYNW